MTKYPMTEEEFIKRVSELFMDSLKQIPNKEKEDYLKSEDIQQFMKELYHGMCGRYDRYGNDEVYFTDRLLLSIPVNNLIMYF